jgi:hypothetical protein
LPAPLFTTNPAEYVRLEGLYVTERNPPGFIQGVSLNTVGVFGQTTRGPVDTPVEITSEARFKEVFGGRDYGNGGTLINHVWRDMLNKPFGKMVVVRALAAAAAKASFTFEEGVDGTGTAVVKVEASSAGAWGNEIWARIDDATDADANHFNLVVKLNGETREYQNLNIKTASDDNLAEVIGDDYGTWITATKVASGRPATSSTITEVNFVAAKDSDNFINLGVTLAAYTTVLGTQGVIAAADYTGTDRALSQIKAYKGVSVVWCAEDDETIAQAVNTAVNTAAAASSDRLFIIWSGDHTDTVAAADSYFDGVDAGTNDRLVKTYNSPYTLDPEIGTLIQVPPSSWMASILSQTEADDHPGAESTKAYTAGISKLTRDSLTREDYVTLREAGICGLERDSGFTFVSGVVSDLTAGKTEITRRRMADKLQLSAADRLKYFVKQRNTETIRAIMSGEIVDFSEQYKLAERIVEDYELDQESQNTATSRAQGLEYILWRVKLIGHILHLVLLTEIGTGVTIEA